MSSTSCSAKLTTWNNLIGGVGRVNIKYVYYWMSPEYNDIHFYLSHIYWKHLTYFITICNNDFFLSSYIPSYNNLYVLSDVYSICVNTNYCMGVLGRILSSVRNSLLNIVNNTGFNYARFDVILKHAKLKLTTK